MKRKHAEKACALGEREIIEILKKNFDLPKMAVPFGDDVSAFDLRRGVLAVLKTDMLVGKTDVPPQMSLWQAARKAVVMNISDFAAKGVQPLTVLASLGLPSGLSEKEIADIGAGLNAGAREYGAYVVGGDTNEASDIVISLSVFGVAKRGALMLRSGAKPDDLVAVTGFFGKTAAGLKFLTSKLEAPKKVSEVLVSSVLMPHARLKEGLVLRRSGAVTASIDSSDGLAWSLHEIASASNVGFVVDCLPAAKEAKAFARTSGLNLMELTFYGGEEYELVLTINPRMWEKARRAVERVGGRLLRIGKVTAEKGVFFEKARKRMVIEPRGWEHFKTGRT